MLYVDQGLGTPDTTNSLAVQVQTGDFNFAYAEQNGDITIHTNLKLVMET